MFLIFTAIYVLILSDAFRIAKTMLSCECLIHFDEQYFASPFLRALIGDRVLN
jgi:hypothetical protein